MNILLVHENYRQPGGEDTVFEAEAKLLERAGHNVLRLEFDNAAIPQDPGILGKVKLSSNTIWSRTSAKRVQTAALEHRADVVHFHNTFPIVSPAAYVACQRSDVPVVQTLHNYRLLCPAADLFRDNHTCEDCLGKWLPYPGIVHGCYRHSRSETAVTAVMLAGHRARGTWRRDIDRFIALTEFSKSMFIKGGLPEELITVKPNFTSRPPLIPSRSHNRFLFVGRLSPEKGIHTLLEASDSLPEDAQIHVLGDGLLAENVREYSVINCRIAPAGQLPHAQVLQEMGIATALIFPSIWYEGFPMTIVEAFASGTPVIASRLGSMAEIITDGETGLHFNPGDANDLATKIRWAMEHPEDMRHMGENARRTYEAKYTPERNYALLMQIYRDVIKPNPTTHDTSLVEGNTEPSEHRESRSVSE